MKLWHKLSLVTVMALLLVTGLAGSMVINKMMTYNKEKTVENYEQQLQSTAYAFARELEISTIGEYSENTKNAYLNFLIKRFGASRYILLEQGEVSCNLTPYTLELSSDALFGDEESVSIIQRVQGQAILICGKKISNVTGGDYELLLVQDITPMYEEIKSLVLYYCMIFLGASVAAVILVFVMTNRLLLPLQELSNAAGALGRGNLSERVPVRAKDEVGVLARAFNGMAGQIEEQVGQLTQESERRRQMLGSLTHELKTPMTAIIGYADSLMHVKLKEEQKERAIRHIYQECSRLGRLSSKLLSLIGMYDNESICLKMTDMSQIIERVEKMESYCLQEKGITLSCYCDMEDKMVDADLMESLLVNLIDNAAKASHSGDEITVVASGNEIAVTDHGCGIPKEEISRVTDAFYMVDKARSRKAGGCGLGLALCSRIATLHGARLEIDSTEGVGTRVVFVLPEVN